MIAALWEMLVNVWASYRDKKARLLGYIAAVVLVVGAAIWLGFSGDN